MLDVYYLPTGKFIDRSRELPAQSRVFIHGYNTYLAPKFRLIQETNHTGASGTYESIWDLGLYFTPDFKQVGFFSDFMYCFDPATVSVGFGIMSRNDVPSKFKDPFTEDASTNYAERLILRTTIGISLITGKPSAL
jgi:hypothetical protein